MTIINLSKDCFGIIVNYLPIEDAINISSLNKDCNKICSYIKYNHVVKCKDLNIIRKHKNIKFSYKSSKLFDIPDNLHTLDLSRTQISDISRFDVKNLHTLDLSGRQINEECVNYQVYQLIFLIYMKILCFYVF